MLRKLLLTIGFALLFFIRPLESGAQVPVTIKCENNAKTVTDIRVQITFPSGEMKAYDGKNLESEALEYHLQKIHDFRRRKKNRCLHFNESQEHGDSL